MGKKAIVIINEQHSLFPQQEKLLRKYYGSNWELLKVPAKGWTLREQAEVAEDLTPLYSTMRNGLSENEPDVVFASPVPTLYGLLASTAGEIQVKFGDASPAFRVLVFHNDQREKVEHPDGRVSQRIAREGWVLVDVTTGQVLD